jgi:hypothetical protein
LGKEEAMRILKTTILVVMGLSLTQARVARGDEVFIDFEHLPSGDPTTMGDLVSDSYAEWGVTFWSYGVTDMPDFFDGYYSDGMFAWGHHCTYPPGFNIVAEFDVPVYTVSADVMTAATYTITMIAKDVDGTTIGSVESDPAPPTFWAGNLTLTTDDPIALVEWWPSLQQASVGVDNLYFVVGEPCVGDLDGDGDVDLSDLAILLAAYDTCDGDPFYNPDADLDDSGCVDLADLATLLAEYGCGT